jgi:hypothetical protein
VVPQTEPGWTIAWLVWLGLFVLIEGFAIARREPGDTLSEQVWAFIRGKPARWVMLAGFLLWLVWHFLGMGRWG